MKDVRKLICSERHDCTSIQLRTLTLIVEYHAAISQEPQSLSLSRRHMRTGHSCMVMQKSNLDGEVMERIGGRTFGFLAGKSGKQASNGEGNTRYATTPVNTIRERRLFT